MVQNYAETLKRFPEKWAEIHREINKRIVGQSELIGQTLAGIFCGGHCLIIGVPGLAKTLLVSTIGEIAGLKFKRIQFTPDMVPSDITGSEILEEDHATGKRTFKFVEGPVFSQIVLADEINRTPPKTQAALLEAMQEGHITAAGKKMELEKPFFVLATQNPIEQEGTYPLPEAQLDRFLFCINVSYPSVEEELRIFQMPSSQDAPKPEKVLSAADIIEFQQAIAAVPIPQSVAEFAVRLTRATRPENDEAPAVIKKYLRWGAGPRACQHLGRASKMIAVTNGRFNVSKEDVCYAAFPVLRHRIITNYNAEADRISPDNLISELIGKIK